MDEPRSDGRVRTTSGLGRLFRRLWIPVVLALLIVSTLIVWQQVRPYENTALAEVDLKSGLDAAWQIVCVVTDSAGAPIPSVRVDVDNSSGGNGAYTDENGVVVFNHMATDVEGIRIEDARILHRPFASYLGTPSTQRGLRVQIRIRDKSVLRNVARNASGQ